jgi:lipopolysaccharide transport system permease protein
MESKLTENHITSKPDTFKVYFEKIWKFRSLIWVLAKRDLKVKYAQTFLGIAWTLIQPLTATIIFSYFFGYVLKWKTENLPYPLYVLSGLLGWNFFSYIMNAGVSSVQESSHLIKKIYFPKSILPLSKVPVALVEFGVSLFVLIPLILFYGQNINWKIIMLPLALLFNAICALSLVFWIAAFAHKKRDLLHVLPFVVYFGIWLTPVFFSNLILPTALQNILHFNPMANVVNIWRWILFDFGKFQVYWIYSFFIMLIFCLIGMFFYNIKENKFTDFV